jgi:hypothetical protein
LPFACDSDRLTLAWPGSIVMPMGAKRRVAARAKLKLSAQIVVFERMQRIERVDFSKEFEKRDS